jgi:adenylate cyclase
MFPAPAWICLAAVLAAFLLHLLDPSPLRALRNGTFDQYQRWRPLVDRDVGVRIVDIDEQSLARLGQWPWPRTRIAELVDRLQHAGAAAIVFDVLFAEPDRTSPQRLLESGTLPAEAAASLARLPDHDQLLAQRIAAGRVVLGFAALHRDEGAFGDLPPARFGSVVRGPSPLPFLPGYEGSVTALPALAEAAAGNGALSFRPDGDGVVRRVPLLLAVGGQLRPSLGAEALRVATASPQYRVEVSEQGVERVDIGPLHLNTTASGELWLHYRHPLRERSLSAWRLFAEPDLAASLRGDIVLLGTSAQGLQDLRFSPLGGIIPGVEIHAQAIEQALSGNYLVRPGWARALEALGLLIGGSLLCLVTLRCRALVSAAVAGAALLAANLAAWLAFLDQRLLLDAFTPSLCLLLALIVAGIVRHRVTEREQRWLRRAFARYVSPNLVQHLVANPAQLALGGERRACSFVFTDLTGFTSLLERQAPEALVSQLNRYLEEMVRIAFRHQGTLDRIVGDAVAVMFSAPIPQPDHQARALACALEMHAFGCRYVEELAARGIAFGHTRIGVHAGEVVVGNFGGATLFDYRALGDPVNTAARLESLNRALGTLLCVSAAIHEACPQVPMRPVGEVLLKGKREPVRVFQPLAAVAGCAELAADADYEDAFALLAAEDDRALDAFERLHARRPDDALVAFHLQRLRRGEQGARFAVDSK